MDITFYNNTFAFLNWGLSFLSLNLALYIILLGNRRRSTSLVALLMSLLGITMAVSGINSFELSKNTFIFFYTLSWIIAGIVSPLLVIASIEYRNEVLGTLWGFSQKLLIGIVVFCVTIGVYFLLSGDIFYTFDSIAWSDIAKTWIIDKEPDILFFYIGQALCTLWVSINCWNVYFVSEKRYLRKRFLLIAISSFLYFLMISLLGIFNYLAGIGAFDIGSGRFLVLNILLLVSIYLFILGVVEHNAFVEDGKSLTRNFQISLFLNIIVGLTYFGVSLLFVYGTEVSDPKVLLLSFMLIVPVGSHQLYHYSKHYLLDKLDMNKNTLELITDEEIQYVIKNYSSLKQLGRSNLLNLNCVKSISKNETLTPIDALRKIVDDLIESFGDPSDRKSRTKPNIKHFILKMVAIDGAVESQILWQLGFEESRSNIVTDSKPLLGLSKNSEYKATSLRSYFRLRKEALDEFKSRLSALEKEIQNL